MNHDDWCPVERDDDGNPVLRLQGEFDLATYAELQGLLAAAVPGDPPERVVIDLSETEFMDCAGVSPIVDWRRRLPSGGCSVVLRHPRPTVRKVLEVVGLDGPCIIEDNPQLQDRPG